MGRWFFSVIDGVATFTCTRCKRQTYSKEDLGYCPRKCEVAEEKSRAEAAKAKKGAAPQSGMLF